MKTLILTSVLALLTAVGMVKAQNNPDEYLGLPGDNLNLYAVMNLFQESETLEAFERSLNDEDSRINNLDLNGDNYIDYISVNDYADGEVHTIVLQVALSPREKQDVAVFTVEKFRDGAVRIQLIGDEALYGRNYIVEPIYAETPNPGYRGRRANRNVTVVHTTYYEVAAWPMVRFIYQPHYVVWRSSWYWGYYPAYWHAWTPYYWHHYYGYHSNWYPEWHRHYRHWHEPRYTGYHDYYHARVRSYSPTVIVNINKGSYKKTYSRPESRREGEIQYAKVHSTRGSNMNSTTRRSTEVRSERSGSSTSVSRSSGNRRSAGSTVTNGSNSRNATMKESNRSGETMRRSSTGNERVNRQSGSTSSQRRTETTVNERKNTSSGESTQVQNRSQVERRTQSVQRSGNTKSGESSYRQSAPENRRTEMKTSGTVSRSEPQKRINRTVPEKRTESVRSSGGNSKKEVSVRSSGSQKTEKESTTRRK